MMLLKVNSLKIVINNHVLWFIFVVFDTKNTSIWGQQKYETNNSILIRFDEIV